LRLQVNGVAVGRELGPDRIPLPKQPPAGSSIIVVAATDAPLLPHQCERLAQRTALGIARTGGAGENSSGDFAVAFASGNAGLAADDKTLAVEMLGNEHIDGLFYGVIEATEEAIVNALLAAETMTGKSGTVHRLDPEAFAEVMGLPARAP
jgi:D-aminopeptidase